MIFLSLVSCTSEGYVALVRFWSDFSPCMFSILMLYHDLDLYIRGSSDACCFM